MILYQLTIKMAFGARTQLILLMSMYSEGTVNVVTKMHVRNVLAFIPYSW